MTLPTLEAPAVTEPLLRVTDLKQYIYCRRIPYWS